MDKHKETQMLMVTRDSALYRAYLVARYSHCELQTRHLAYYGTPTAADHAVRRARYEVIEATKAKLGAADERVFDHAWLATNKTPQAIQRDDFDITVTLEQDPYHEYGTVNNKWARNAIVVTRLKKLPRQLRHEFEDSDTVYYHPPKDARCPADYRKHNSRHAAWVQSRSYDYSDMHRFFGWCEDLWTYYCLIVKVSRNGVELGVNGCGGLEVGDGMTDIDHLNEAAEDCIAAALEEAREALAELAPKGMGAGLGFVTLDLAMAALAGL